MVKGISRRVVVVRPPHGGVFEQAFFIVRDDGQKSDALREACAVAESYLGTALCRRPRRRYTRVQLGISAGAGAALTGLLWLLCTLLL